MATFKVRIGDKETRVRFNPFGTMKLDAEGEVWVADFIGGYHNFDGPTGVAVARAVEKLFGKRCFWFGGCDDLSHGQVFEALRPTKGNSHPGNTARTPTVRLDVETV